MLISLSKEKNDSQCNNERWRCVWLSQRPWVFFSFLCSTRVTNFTRPSIPLSESHHGDTFSSQSWHIPSCGLITKALFKRCLPLMTADLWMKLVSLFTRLFLCLTDSKETRTCITISLENWQVSSYFTITWRFIRGIFEWVNLMTMILVIKFC